MHRRLERHRRLRNNGLTAQNIRDTVERSQDHHAKLEARLIGFGNAGSGDDDTTDSTGGGGGRTGAGEGSNAGGRAAGGESTTSTTGRGSGSGSGTGSDSDTSTGGRATALAPTRPATTSSSSSTSSASSSSSSSSSSATPTTTSSSSSSSSTERTSSTPTATSSSSTRTSRTSEELDLPTSATSVTDANSLATSVRVITQSPTRIASATATPSNTNDGPGAGPIIGIVAGALAGLVLVAAAVSYLVKWYGKKKDVDPYEANPFDRDDFRRQSVMIPDGFDSDDGHGLGRTSPEYHGHNTYNDEMVMANGASSASLGGGAATAAALGAGGAAVAASSSSHNGDAGRPRPPTMFARHQDAHAPSVGAVFNQPPVVPQLPPMAFGGGDPYSLAGVAGGMHNVSNPYAHLDRGHGDQQNLPQRYNSYRSGSNGSNELAHSPTGMVMSPGSYARPGLDHNEEYGQRTHETSGRPGTAEGRSGTPDIPNVQQTYALGGGESEDGHAHNSGESGSHGGNSPVLGGSGRQSGFDFNDRALSPSQGARGSWSPPQLFSDQGRATMTTSDDDAAYFAQMQQQYGGASPRPESIGAAQSLQVRNLTGGQQQAANHLMPNPHDQRPRSTASDFVDDDAAYGGVY